MPNFCAMYKCGNRAYRDKKSLFRLPAIVTREGEETFELSKERRGKWLAQISRDIKDTSLPYIRVCSDHFVSGKPAYLYDRTNPDWVPSLKLGHNKVTPDKVERDSGRYKRAQTRQTKKVESNAAQALLLLQSSDEVNNSIDECPGTASQTSLEGSTIESTTSELQRLLDENRMLKAELSKSMYDQQFFEGEDERVKYYTGLVSFSVLLVLFKYLEAFIPTGITLTKFQHLILVLMKLRLRLSVIDIGHRFGVTKTTVSRIFLTMIDIMYIRLKPLIVWPEREHLRETMPLSFITHFGKTVTVIVDCFEIFLERPSNLGARASTWSSYKHNNTVKYMIGITPQGLISYISKGWGGRVSDKYLTEHSDFLRKLDPGDVVLADRGFNIDDSVALTGAKVIYPAFTKGKKQLSAIDVEQTRRIANVRIHVERVIGSLRQKYAILSTTIPIDYVICSNANGQKVTLDKIVVVCCALINMCPSVVSFN
ncbi:uncharacterized protein LOC135158125 [Lytechinus pictus]|uniref:uncharacterized protein LOC135158125 n=1 Tax=Lytechinus pictus TaxID=7653 RepID=UPI0030BA1E0A